MLVNYCSRLETDKNHMSKGKYDMEMIRCVWGKTIEFLPIKMLTGVNLKAVEKRRGAGIEIADPDLHTKATRAQLKALSFNFPELDPDFTLPPEPLPLTDAELGDLLAEPVAVHETIIDPETETPEPTIKRRGRKPKTTA